MPKGSRRIRAKAAPTLLLAPRLGGVPDSPLIPRALWQHLQEQGPTLLATSDRPLSHPVFFLTMQVIYAASYPPDVTRSKRLQALLRLP